MRVLLSHSLLCLVLLGAGSARAEEATEFTESSTTPETSSASTGDESAKEDKSVDERGDGNIRGGELTSAGATTLQTRGTRVGLRVGASKIGQVFYLAGSAEFDLAIKKFNMGLGLPVQIPVFDPSKGLKLFPEGMSLRQQDYARWENFVRLVRYVSYGNKEGDFYLNIAQQYAATIGHGGAVRRYLSNLDVDQAKLSGQLDMKFKYGGFELYSGDDNFTLPLLAVGAVGVIGVATHWAGTQVGEMIAAFAKGDIARAIEINATLIDSWDYETGDDNPNPIPAKAMLRALGLPAGQCRLPLGPAPDGLEARALEVWRGLGNG